MPKTSNTEKRDLWKNRIQEQQKSGLSIEKWCRDNQVSAHCLHYWKKKLFPTVSPKHSNFIELTDKPTCTIDIQYENVHLRIESPSFKHSFNMLKNLAC